MTRLSSSAPPGGGAPVVRLPVIVIDADERPVSISPGLRTSLGLAADGRLPGTLHAIMDEASAWRVHAALRYRGTGVRDNLLLRLMARSGEPIDATVEFLPTTGGGAVLVVSRTPGPWTEEDTASLLDRTQDLVLSVRLQPTVAFRYVNAASAIMTGYDADEIRSEPGRFIDAIHPDDRAMVAAAARDARRLEAPLIFRFRHRSGEWRWLEVSATPTLDESGRVIAIDGVCRDITERQEVEATLQGMNRRMNLLARLTRHDTLNQLTVLLGSLELAGTAESTTELAWFLSRSREAAWAIQRLTEFTRDYQEIGQGAPDWVSLTALVQRAADSFAGGGVTIEAPDEGWEIRADPLIEQVFYNLIENALRHGGTVRRVRFSVEAQSAGGAVIACEDDGTGVPVNEKEQIFERGYGRNTGLGLYLSREILATTGMTITESGRPGAGARFEIRVPPDTCRIHRAPGQEGLLLHHG